MKFYLSLAVASSNAIPIHSVIQIIYVVEIENLYPFLELPGSLCLGLFRNNCFDLKTKKEKEITAVFVSEKTKTS